MTTPRVAKSRVVSMPSNASAESAAWPPAPAMWTCHAVDGGDVADLVGGVGHVVPAVLAEVEGDEGLRDLAVLGRDRARRTVAVDAVQRRANSSALRAAARGAGPSGSARRALVDDQGGDVVRGPGTARACPAPGSTRRWPGSHDDASLFWTSVSFCAKPLDTPDDEDPDGEHDPLGDAAGEPSGDLTMHGRTPAEGGDIRHQGFPRSDPFPARNSSPVGGIDCSPRMARLDQYRALLSPHVPRDLGRDHS